MSAISSTESIENVRWPKPQRNIVKSEERYMLLSPRQGWTEPWGQMSEEALLIDVADSIPDLALYLQRSADVTSPIERVLHWLLQNQVMIPQPAQVRDYLLRYPDITDLLPSVCKKTRELLGMPSQLSVELYHDPEIKDEYLTLYVRQPEYDRDIIKRIEEARSLYEEILERKTGWFLVTTDFRPPK